MTSSRSRGGSPPHPPCREAPGAAASPAERPARLLLAVRPARQPRLHQARAVQIQLSHHIAEPVGPLPYQSLVQVLHVNLSICSRQSRSMRRIPSSSDRRSHGLPIRRSNRPKGALPLSPASERRQIRSPTPASPPPPPGSTRPTNADETSPRIASCGPPAAPPPAPSLARYNPAWSASQSRKITRHKLRTDDELTTGR